MVINGNYILDIDNIIKFCFESDDKVGDSEITEVYMVDDDEKKLSLSSKQLREVKTGDVTTKQTMKYDLIKTFIADLVDIDSNDVTFGDAVIVNTMINEGLLKEINE